MVGGSGYTAGWPVGVVDDDAASCLRTDHHRHRRAPVGRVHVDGDDPGPGGPGGHEPDRPAAERDRGAAHPLVIEKVRSWITSNH
jgi:hypothetical protein